MREPDYRIFWTECGHYTRHRGDVPAYAVLMRVCGLCPRCHGNVIREMIEDAPPPPGQEGREESV